MKLLLFSGTHSRHLYVNKEIIKHFKETLVIIMEREELIPNPPSNIDENDRNNFIKHFKNRSVKEKDAYGNLSHETIFKNHEKIYLLPNELNTFKTANKIKEFDADLSIIFGVDLILDPVFDKLPKDKLNIHLGLSPWYKGGATLFWPFYFLQPQFAGITIHQISKNPDEGEIIHQSTPKLEYEDTIHDVGVKCVKNAKNDIIDLINFYKSRNHFPGKIQKTSGRVWRGKDFHPSHLRVIYDLFNDKMVDKYLDGELGNSKPILYSCLRS
tara:strand:+ start:1189 stop:1998 length:810 start_codon:yes stop_codon:yes gene_type:complete